MTITVAIMLVNGLLTLLMAWVMFLLRDARTQQSGMRTEITGVTTTIQASVSTIENKLQGSIQRVHDRVDEVHDRVNAVHEQLRIQNGKVIALETWKVAHENHDNERHASIDKRDVAINHSIDRLQSELHQLGRRGVVKAGPKEEDD